MNNKAIGLIVTVVVLVTISVPSAWAQPEGETVPEWAEDGRNEVGLFLGFTAKEGEVGPSLGLDYEYRVNRLFGVGVVLFELSGAEFRDGIFAVSLLTHPWKELKIVTAPGVEVNPAERSNEFIVRVGAEYGFGFGRGFEIAPSLYFDISIEDVAVVFGVSASKHF